MLEFILRIVFIISALSLLLLGEINPIMISTLNILLLLSGIVIAGYLLRYCYIYTALLYGFHVIMTSFTIWVYLHKDYVLRTEEYGGFDVFTEENLKMAVYILLCSVLTIMITNIFFVKDHKILLIHKIDEIFMSRGRASQKVITLFIFTLFFSFLLGILFISTNTTVLDVAYPAHAALQWLPNIFFKLPVLLSVSSLFLSYRLMIDDDSSNKWLLLARCNFILMVFVMLLGNGSRGFVTFLMLFIAILEFYFWRNKKSKILWSLLFFFLSWWSYWCWSILRTGLAWLPWDVLISLQLDKLFFIQKVNVNTEGAFIDLTYFNMIGQSLFHLLDVIQLIRDGISLKGSTYLNLIVQLLPAFNGLFDWDRPLNDNYRLGEFYPGCGGFLMIANAYWNGGLVAALIFIAILTFFFLLLDRYMLGSNSSYLYKFSYILLFPSMVVQLAYGIQGMARVVEILVMLLWMDKLGRSSSKVAVKMHILTEVDHYTARGHKFKF